MAKYTAAELRKMLAEAEASEGKFTDLREKIDALCKDAGVTLAEVLRATGNPTEVKIAPKYRFKGAVWSGQGAYPPKSFDIFEQKKDKTGKTIIYHLAKPITVKEAKAILAKEGHEVDRKGDKLTAVERKAEKKAKDKDKDKAVAYTPVE